MQKCYYIDSLPFINFYLQRGIMIYYPCKGKAVHIMLTVMAIILTLMLPVIALAAENGRIVFSANVSGSWDIWTVSPYTQEMKQITSTPDDEHSPTVSPDGKEIVYISKRELWIMKSDGSDRNRIPLPAGIYAQPVWSPDGQRVAFVKYTVLPSDESEIWSVKRNGAVWNEPERITIYPPMRLSPAFSPDNSRLAFTEFKRDELRGNIEEIVLMEFGKKKVTMVTSDNADSFDAVWSPDNQALAYTSNRDGNYDIWVVTLSDGKHVRITENPLYDGEPAWSPDGKEIAFVSSRSGSKEIWITPRTGGLQRQVTKTGKTCKDPVWVK
jgi:TolB protein